MSDAALSSPALAVTLTLSRAALYWLYGARLWQCRMSGQEGNGCFSDTHKSASSNQQDLGVGKRKKKKEGH